jgi:hypothetical protein
MKQNFRHLCLPVVLFLFAFMGCDNSVSQPPDIPVYVSEFSDSASDPSFIILDDSYRSAARFSGKNIFTLIRSVPASKPEGDSLGDLAAYSYTLSTSGGSALLKMSDTALSSNAAADDAVTGPSNAQAELDIRLRDIEQGLLSAGIPQLSKKDLTRSVASSSISVGTHWNDVYIHETGSSINTTCTYISEHAYFFVNEKYSDVPGIEDYGEAFDRIYDVNHEKLGYENDVDANGKVIIVITSLPGNILGYFYPGDKYPKSFSYPHSNEGDIFYIRWTGTSPSQHDEELIKATLAHEFQHMIYFDEHYNRGSSSMYIWLNEALSQAAEYYNDYLENQNEWISAFLSENQNQENLSLTHWTNSNYGYAALFIRYLIDRHGDGAIKNMCATDLSGIAAVESATGIDFNNIFTDFTRALIMSGTGDSPNFRYAFRSLNLQEIQTEGRGGLIVKNSGTAGTPSSDIIYPYSIKTVRWTGDPDALRLAGNNVRGDVFGLSR